jgi:hypothetical protein
MRIEFGCASLGLVHGINSEGRHLGVLEFDVYLPYEI